MHRLPESDLPFWERPEVVEMFASRAPDKRMLALLEDAPKDSRVLDIGCAGGRNSLWLAEQGLDFYAVDASKAMLAKTKERVAEVMSQAEADKRVLETHMDDLRKIVLLHAEELDKWMGQHELEPVVTTEMVFVRCS